MVRLAGKEVREQLKHLQGWRLADKSIQRKFKFKNFVQAVQFVNKLVPIAEKMQHHPDLQIKNYNEVIVSSTTHDAGGLTKWDFQLANKINKIAK